MTSTKFNVGLTDGNRSSSRVLRPPGGGHTDIFGGEPEPVRGRRQAPNAPNASSIGNHDVPAKPTNGTDSKQHNEIYQEENGQEQQLPTEMAKVEVPETKAEAPVAELPKLEAPKRVRVPPGGFSSQLW